MYQTRRLWIHTVCGPLLYGIVYVKITWNFECIKPGDSESTHCVGSLVIWNSVCQNNMEFWAYQTRRLWIHTVCAALLYGIVYVKITWNFECIKPGDSESTLCVQPCYTLNPHCVCSLVIWNSVCQNNMEFWVYQTRRLWIHTVCAALLYGIVYVKITWNFECIKPGDSESTLCGDPCYME